MQVNTACGENAMLALLTRTIVAAQMAGETIKIFLMMALIGAIELAVNASQLRGVIHRRRWIFPLPWRQMRLASRHAHTRRRHSQR
jgi:hypothetical protein